MCLRLHLLWILSFPSSPPPSPQISPTCEGTRASQRRDILGLLPVSIHLPALGRFDRRSGFGSRLSGIFDRWFPRLISRASRLDSMEKELLQTFDIAKKAADVASEAGGPSPEVDRCVDALRRLRRIPVTTQNLVETQVLASSHVSSSSIWHVTELSLPFFDA